jgi:hypothetical protein
MKYFILSAKKLIIVNSLCKRENLYCLITKKSLQKDTATRKG